MVNSLKFLGIYDSHPYSTKLVDNLVDNTIGRRSDTAKIAQFYKMPKI
jgi:hypothetical protein